MKTYLFDTDVLIDHLCGTVSLMDYVGAQDPSDRYACSIITMTELIAGVRANEEVPTRELLHGFILIPVHEAIAELAGDYLRSYRAKGITLHLADALVAATARIENALLVTRNAKHFPMLKDKITKTR